jgi:hypothetical protein
LLVALSGAAGIVQAAPLPVLAPGAYLSGGVGEGGQQDMQATRDLYNLRLTFAEAGTGAYIAGVSVVIEPVGHGPLYGPFTDCGPLFHMVLGPGAWRVSVTHEGRTQTRIFRLGKGGATQATFYWPAPPT